MIVLLQKGYCCCTLRAASLFIGIMDLIFSILECLLLGYMLHLAQDKNNRLAKVYYLCFGLLIAGLLLYVGSIILVHGTYRRSKWALIPFLVILPAVVIASIVLLHSAVPSVPLVIVPIIGTIGAVMTLYHWIIVFSYFAQLYNSDKEEREKGDDDLHEE